MSLSASIYQQKGFRKRALPLLFEAQRVAKKLNAADQTTSALALGIFGVSVKTVSDILSKIGILVWYTD